MKKIVISKLNNQDILFLFNDNHDVELIKCIDTSIVDNVYMAKIVEINKGLNACFASISNDQKVYISLSSFKGNKPKCGDELPVQIKVDALKTKLPEGDPNICLPGQYCVCHINKEGISVSRKLDKDTQEILLNKILDLKIEGIEKFGFVIRTNAEYLIDDISPLKDEIKMFIEKMSFLSSEAEHRSIYSVLYENTSSILGIISDIPLDMYDSIVTDNICYYNELISNNLFSTKDIKYHDDEYVSLKNLHSLETFLNRALDKKVYLDCGGYLIIEPTEAMTVIDVNSGKMDTKKKDTKDSRFKVNYQAAIEIAKQIRIRNLSGIIMIDFINMDDDDDNEKLIKILRDEVSKDRVKTTVVDMTPLGIVEITRKKINDTLLSSIKCN